MTEVLIYAAGEIHSDWRGQLEAALDQHGIQAELVGPHAVHEESDDVGEAILGDQPNARYRDLMGGRVNTMRTRFWMSRADLAVAYFGPKYKQWNTASDAGAALQAGIPLIVIRAEEHVHALKELDAQASLTVETLEQAAKAIAYILM